ncbi:urease accessory protein UreE [Rhodococcus pyridinivorans]|uniref:urease accessory protein UreE n=1 Tax=Rhodococcus pyridinivorans TaxID=103816 RepID=UPI002225FBEF|nr:urease accessory protein UreE [Rhodococcus pyridinivorans]MCW3469212.1 urease accessory protein UreE [Rhodococcus pyridinivorans]
MEATTILGDATDPQYAHRQIDTVRIPWGDARKHRQVLTTLAGHELTVNLPRGTFLSEGAVIADDGTTIVVVTRPPEDAVVMDFADNVGVDAIRRALVFGYILGNQHAPLEVSAEQLRTPLMTSAHAAEQMLRDLHLNARVDAVALAAHGWTNTSADHHHTRGTSHPHGHGHGH